MSLLLGMWHGKYVNAVGCDVGMGLQIQESLGILLQGPLGDFVVAQVLVLEAPRVVPSEEPLLPPVVSLLAVLDLKWGMSQACKYLGKLRTVSVCRRDHSHTTSCFGT